MTDLQQRIFELAYRRRSSTDLIAAVIEEAGDLYRSVAVKIEILNMVTLGLLEMDDAWEVKARDNVRAMQ